MYRLIDKRLSKIIRAGDASLLRGGRRGIEKESLRTRLDGQLSARPHPDGLGSALTNPYITTDYSEALLELITPPHRTNAGVLRFLSDVHQFVYEQLDDEMLWCPSMPCSVSADTRIPLARYGDSNVGRMKTVYRRGLGHRYGRLMQTISGVHFNYSLPDALWPVYQANENNRDALGIFRSAAYFCLLRNFRRYGWLILYLFGASPAVCRTFVAGREHGLEALEDGTLYLPHATSLRMSDLGYRNSNQARIEISLDGLDAYMADLSRAINTVNPAYAEMGVVVDGEYLQLNANELQIENEYYSLVRPKRAARSGERPTHALRRGGVEYVEVRALDVNAFDPVGVNEDQLRFLEAFLIFCLLQESPVISSAEQKEINANQDLVANQGRRAGLTLKRGGAAITLQGWSRELLEALEGVCEALDERQPGRDYSAALTAQKRRVEDPEATPSAALLEEMARTGESFMTLGLRLSRAHREYFRVLPGTGARHAELVAATVASVTQQAEIEAADQQSFEAYLAQYFAQTDVT